MTTKTKIVRILLIILFPLLLVITLDVVYGFCEPGSRNIENTNLFGTTETCGWPFVTYRRYSFRPELGLPGYTENQVEYSGLVKNIIVGIIPIAIWLYVFRRLGKS